MKATTLLKYVTIDKEKVKVKLDIIKQEPKQRVQTHYD
jgi:septum formation topological specificity factor MinE